MPKRQITRAMMIEALERGMHNALASRHFGFSPKSFHMACQREGISLPYAKQSPQMPSDRDDRNDASDVRVKAWSASPAAIDRALRQVRR